MNRKCFSCGIPISPVVDLGEDSFSMPPNEATCWQSSGNYGSTIFDGGEFTGERLELFICDRCLRLRSDLVYKFRTINNKIENFEVFVPNELIGPEPQNEKIIEE